MRLGVKQRGAVISTPMSPLHHLLPLSLLLLTSAATTVTHLPGFRGPLPFQLETGYVNVDEGKGVELFYYFVPSERSPGDDPLILWLTGGPGCSAFSGLVFEIGPLKFVTAKYDGSIPSLEYNPFSWTKITNIIFLDSPVGTGFSFARKPEGYVIDETTSCEQIHKFLRKWFVKHPQFISNELYIAGDSYAGKVVPIVAYEVAKGIEAGHRPHLNLKGYLIGNPGTGELVDKNSRVPYAHGVGLISDELYEEVQRNCEGEDYMDPNPENFICSSALDKFHLFYSEVNPAYTLDPHCPLASPPRKCMNGARSLQEKLLEFLEPPPVPELKCRSYAYYLSYYWANDYKTRKVLNIKKGTVKEWVRCNSSMSYTLNIRSSVMYHLNVIKKGYRALVYSGDKDMVVPFIGTQAWIRSLNFTIVDDWRSWHVDGQVAGYTRKYANDLTFATVKDAGHTAPEYMPENCLMMLERWISHKPL